jgi:hypothetical protein
MLYEADMKLRIHSVRIILTSVFTVLLFLSSQFGDAGQSKAVASSQAVSAFEEGQLQITIAETFPEDDSPPVSRTQYYLVSNSGHAIELPGEMISQVSMLKPGSRLRIWGLNRGATGKSLMRGSNPPRVQLLAAPLATEKTGNHDVLYLLASFDGQEQNPFSLADVSALADQVSAEYSLMSRSRVRLISHKPVAWLRVPGTLNCDLFDMSRRVDAAARQSGIPIDEYRYRVYILPSKSECPFGGIATVGGDPARAWINDFRKGVVVHEYGHAGFSRLHANLWQCPSTFDSTVPNCSAESSNPYSAMGNGSRQLLFTPQDMKDLGWTNLLAVSPQNMGRAFRLVAADLNLPVGENENESLEIQFAGLATRVYIDARRNVEEPSVRNGVLVYLEGKPGGSSGIEFHTTHLLPDGNIQDPARRNYGLELGKSLVIGGNMITVIKSDERGATVYIDNHLDSNPPLSNIKNTARAKKTVTVNGVVEDNIIVSRVEFWITRKDKKGRVVSREKLLLNNFTPKQQGEILAAEISLPKSQSASIQMVAYDGLDNIGFSTEVSVKKWKP